MVKFNLHYGQSRVRRAEGGEPIRMYHRVQPLRRAIQFQGLNGDRLNVQYDANLENGTIEIEELVHIAEMYMLGYPLQVSEIDPDRDIELERRPAPEVALAALNAMPIRLARLYGQSQGVEGMEDRQMISITSKRIEDPWAVFGIQPQLQRKVDLNNPPPFLQFPRPDVAWSTTLADDPFWIAAGADVVTRIEALLNLYPLEFRWSSVYELTT